KGIRAEQVAGKISDKIKLIIITSPTYEGVESDIDAICKTAHKHNIPVLVDAAHGAHLFDKYHNADIVIRSLHKTLPALTQCAAANIYGNLINSKVFEIKLSMFETSSPSYVLLCSIEKCVDYITNNTSDEYYNNLCDFYNIKLSHLSIIKYDDSCKIVVFTGYSNISGYELADILRESNIEIEMASQDYIIAISSICDKAESLIAFKQALTLIDSKLEHGEYKSYTYSELPVKSCEAYEINRNIEAIDINSCAESISAEYIWAYPPGIPIIVPGEIINDNLIKYVNNQKETDFQSTYSCLPEKIYCKMV
ncbi:MAG: PLP-dependent transferase, partial [Ruminococcus sp.]|nr:PLP-dependent transferase [Ruminococcus sp.]